jgi:hypothetical protein
MPGVNFREFRQCRIEAEGPLEGASRLVSPYGLVLMQGSQVAPLDLSLSSRG